MADDFKSEEEESSTSSSTEVGVEEDQAEASSSANSSQSSSGRSSPVASDDEQVEEEQEQAQPAQEITDILQQTNGHQKTVSFNVVTRNVKKVEWPPKDESGAPVRLPLARRFKKDWSFNHNNKPVSSFPFSRGYNPSKLEVDAIYKPETEAINNSSFGKPKVVLRDAKEVLTREVMASSCTQYRMPPGTSRTRKCQEVYENVLPKEKTH